MLFSGKRCGDLTVRNNHALGPAKLRSVFLALFALAIISVEIILATLALATAAHAQPAFTKAYAPDTIGPGSVSTLTFTITNGGATPVTDLEFTDTLDNAVPLLEVVIADPANASTTCDIADGGAGLDAPAGGGTITFADGEIAGAATCTISVDVTSSVVGTHSNLSGDLTSSAGNSGTAMDDLNVVTTLPGFSKVFAPSSVPLGGRSTLTFTIDNTLGALVGNLDFIDYLPDGMVVADPADASTDCVRSDTTLTATPGTSFIDLDANGSAVAGSEVLPAGATCTVTVDVVAVGAGMLDNVSDELLADFVSAGKASATLDVTVTPIALQKSFTDDPMPPGGTATLDFTIDNFDRNYSATAVAFTDDLTTLVPALAGLTYDSLLANSCGGSVSGVGGTTISFSGGAVAAQGSCTISVSLSVPAATTPGAYTNTTGAITGTVDGSPVVGNMASDALFVEPTPVLTKEFLEAGTLVSDPVINVGDDVVIRFTVTNTSTTSSATDIEFLDELTDGGPSTGFLPFPVSVTLPPDPDPPCGAGSSLALVSAGTDRQALELTGGSLDPAPGAGSTCTFDVILTVPDDMAPSVYLNTTEEPSATVDGATRTGDPASDTLTVIAAPSLTKAFTDDPVAPGGAVTLEFTLSYSLNSPADATAITFTDDLNAVITDLAATAGQLPMTGLCPAGDGTLAGSAGDTLLTFSGATLEPGEDCTFSLTLDVPAAAAGSHTNTTSGVGATVDGSAATSPAASDDLKVAGLTFTKEFLGDPVIAGDTVTLRFTIDNVHPTDDATDIVFTDSLSDVLPGTPDLTLAAALPTTPCGPSSSITGTSSLVFTGGELAQGSPPCTFDVTLEVPAGAADGAYANVTSNLTATQGGGVTIDPANDNLTVNSNLLQLTKEFTDDPVSPGGTVTLEFTLTNLDAAQAASNIDFTDDLDAALSGQTYDSVLSNDCGATVSGLATTTITVTGASLTAGGTCTISTSLTVPGGAAAGLYTNTTSGVTGLIGGLAVSGDAASDDLEVIDLLLLFSKSFDSPTVASGTAVLTFTITNPGASTATGISFSDNLDAVLTGLEATNVLLDVPPCGAGSVLAGTSTLTFTGGELPPTGGTCSFRAEVTVPPTATAGTFANTTSDLIVNGLKVADPATSSLTIEPPPAFAKSFSPDTIFAGDVSTLSFTIDNSASSLAASNLEFTDNLPAGVVVATTPGITNTCSGAVTATAGSDVISLTDGSVGAGSTCAIDIDVTSSTDGAHVNTTGDLTSSSGNSGTASDTLTVEVFTFAKAFSPDIIGPGSVSTLQFDIANTNPSSTADNLAFTDNLPAGVTIAAPAATVNDCGGTVSAPDGGNTISLANGQLAPSDTCSIQVNVTSSSVGTHTNTSGDLTSDIGDASPANANLTVTTGLPGFTKSFSPNPVAFGSRSTLTFAIDNTGNVSTATDLTFSDALPSGLVVADPANESANCTGGVITATPGTGLISYGPVGVGDASVAAGASCTISVDVTGSSVGLQGNTTGELTSNLGSSGKAGAVLEVTGAPILLTKAFTDDPTPPGDTVTLEFTLRNGSRDFPATNISFDDDLSFLTGLEAVGLPSNDVCGAGSQITGTTSLAFTGGSIAPEGSCTFSMTLQVPGGATPGTHTNTTSSIAADVDGAGVTGQPASDDLFIEATPILTKLFVGDPVGTGDDIVIQFSVENTSTVSAASDIAFIDELTTFLPFPVSVTLPPVPDPPCGAGSSLALISLGTERQGLELTGGNLAASGTCTFEVTLTLPVGLAGSTYTNTTGEITATVDGMTVTGNPASDDFDVVAAPSLTKEFTDDPVPPGGTVTLEFILTHDEFAPGDATGIAFTDDLASTLTGLTATGLPLADVCGTGSQISGTTSLSFTGGSLTAGETCTFSVTLDVPDPAATGSHANTTSGVTATVLGITATGNAATDDLMIAGLTIVKSFTDDPVLPGGTVNLEFTIANISPVDDATGISFTDDLDAVLSGLEANATGMPQADICGSGSTLSGSTSLSFAGGILAAGESCTFNVTLDVPADAAANTYVNTTSDFEGTLDGSVVQFDNASDELTVFTGLSLTKSFTDDPVTPGSTVNLEFTVTNLAAAQAATGIAFTDNLDGTLSGLAAVGLPLSDPCGAGSQLSGTDTLTFSGGDLSADSSCTFSVTLQVPAGAAHGTYTNTTSTVTGDVGGVAAEGDAASDDLSLSAMTSPQVTTQDVSDISTTTATGNGNITKLGTPNPTQHGVVWNTTGMPTTADNRTEEGAASATGAFTSAITGLSPNTTYYVRAYATNSLGTVYGDEVSFTTTEDDFLDLFLPVLIAAYLQPATVTTQAVSDITANAATGNGNIVTLGRPNPTQHGVVWNTTGAPTITDNKTEEGVVETTGTFTSNITGLSADRTYYVRAYATNNAGTSYGNEVSFTTRLLWW